MPQFTGLDPYALSAGGGGTLEIEWGPHRDEPLRVEASLDTAADYLENMRPVLSAARQAVAADIREHFDQGVGPDGAWPARATDAVLPAEFEFQPGIGHVQTAPMRRDESSGPLLVKTGAGRAVATSIRSFAIQADESGGSIIFDADPPSYLLTHNAGSPGRYTQGGFFEGPNPLPQREWLWLSEGAGEVIFELFEAFVEDAIGIVTAPGGGTVLRGPGGMFVPVNVQGTY